MTPRTSVAEMESGWSRNAGQKVMFIPDLRVLAYMTPEESLEQFETDWGATDEKPTVCLPLVGVDGVSFDNKIAPAVPISAKVTTSRATERLLGEVARAFVDLGCRLHLYVNPAMEFLRVEVCHVLDIRNVGSFQACVQKKKTREFLNYLIGTGIGHVAEHLENGEESIESLVVDITDLWGMSGTGGWLSLCCFCDECRAALERYEVRIAAFENFPNPWNLALQHNEGGISYIDNISRGETPTSIVGKSALRGFDRVFGDDHNLKLQAASELMTYMTARHKMVEDFLLDIFAGEAYLGKTREEGRKLRRVAVVEGTDYDWTAGVFPSALVSSTVDELWLDPAATFPQINVPYKTFMWNRATYFLNAFFQLLSNAADIHMRVTTEFGRLPTDRLRDLLRERGAIAMSKQLTGPRQVAALRSVDASRRNGIVGVLLTQAVLDDLLRNPTIAPGAVTDGAGPVPRFLQLLRKAMEEGATEDY